LKRGNFGVFCEWTFMHWDELWKFWVGNDKLRFVTSKQEKKEKVMEGLGLLDKWINL
jgi:hypothetical protein